SLIQPDCARTPAEQFVRFGVLSKAFGAQGVVCCNSPCPTPEPLKDFPQPCRVQAAGAPRRCTCSSR
ncbi:unnamed protein product, partial [Bubo scandiacus]